LVEAKQFNELGLVLMNQDLATPAAFERLSHAPFSPAGNLYSTENQGLVTTWQLCNNLLRKSLLRAGLRKCRIQS